MRKEQRDEPPQNKQTGGGKKKASLEHEVKDQMESDTWERSLNLERGTSLKRIIDDDQETV